MRKRCKGKWPTHDAYGREYPAGTPEADRADTYLFGNGVKYFCVLWSVKSDLDFDLKDGRPA